MKLYFFIYTVYDHENFSFNLKTREKEMVLHWCKTNEIQNCMLTWKQAASVLNGDGCYTVSGLWCT